MIKDTFLSKMQKFDRLESPFTKKKKRKKKKKKKHLKTSNTSTHMRESGEHVHEWRG